MIAQGNVLRQVLRQIKKEGSRIGKRIKDMYFYFKKLKRKLKTVQLLFLYSGKGTD